MKNQYFGDVNDYRKYGLIRILSDQGALCVGMCWMLTGSDNRTDGQFTTYLDKDRKYRQYDESLFDSLKGCLSGTSGRDVCHASRLSIIPRAVYYDTLLSDSDAERREYFEGFARASRHCDLVFFDPDNGLEIKSKSKGHKDSCKYLYWDELEQTYAMGKSVLVYQHFRRENREKMIEALSTEIRTRLGAPNVIAFRTAHVLFLLIPHPAHQELLEQQAKTVAEQWHPEIMKG